MIFKYDDVDGFALNSKKKLTSTTDSDETKALINSFNNSKLSADAFKESMDGVDDALFSYLSTCKNGEAHTTGFEKHIQKTNNSIGLTGVKSKMAAVGVGLLNSALSMGISLLAGFVIGEVISFFDDIIHRSEKIAEVAREAREEMEALNDSFKDKQTYVEDYGKRFAELSQGVNSFTGENESLSTEEYSEFLELSSKLAEMFPSLERHYLDNGDAILSLSGNIDTIVNSLNELIEKEKELKNIQIAEDLDKQFADVYEKHNEYLKDKKAKENELSVARSVYENYSQEQLKENVSNVLNNKQLGLTMQGTAEEYGQLVDYYNDIFEKLGVKYAIQKDMNPDWGGRLNENGEELLTYSLGITIDSEETQENIDGAKQVLDYSVQQVYNHYSDLIGKLAKDISILDEKNEINWLSLTDGMDAWLNIQNEFKTLDPILKPIVQNLANSNLEQGTEYIKENILEIFSGISEDIDESVITALSDGENNEALYISAIQNIQNKINDYIKDNGLDIKLDVSYLFNDIFDSKERMDKKLSSMPSQDEKNELEQYVYKKGIDTSSERDYFLSVTKNAKTAKEAIIQYEKSLLSDKQSKSVFFNETNNKNITEYIDQINDLTSYYSKLHSVEGLSYEDKIKLHSAYDISATSSEGYEKAILSEIASMETESAIIKVIKDAIEDCTDAKERLRLETLLNSITNVDNEAIVAAKGFDTLGNAMSTLQSRAELLRDIHKDINKFGKIDVSGLNAILSAYPELEEKVSLYNAGLMTEAELFNELKKAYATDKQNYINLMSIKLQFDEAFYDGITEKIPNWLKELADSYGIDFENFKNLCDLKLAAQKELVKKQLQLEAARTVMNTIIAKKAPSDDPTERVGYTDSASEQNGTGSIDTFIETKKQYAELLKLIDGIDDLVGNGLDLDWKTFGIDSETITKIDWADQALSVLQEAVDDAQTALENADGFQAQLDAIDDLNDALGDLKSGYETAKGVYETRYTNGLNKLSNKKEIQQKIESGKEFSLDPYNSEEAEIIQELIDLYAKIKEAEDKIAELGTQIYDNENYEKSKIRQSDLESQLDVVDEKLNDTTLSTKDKIDLLEQRYELQKSINDELRIQAKLEGNTEKVKQLDEKDKNNEYQKNSDIYDTNKEDVLRNVSKNDNEITDIQNDIDLAGHGTVEQYDKIINLQKANIGEWETQKKVAYEMREANKDNAALYEYWDNELQDCEDNIYQMNSGIKEMQQAILNLPLQEVEEKLQSINKEIDSRNRELNEQTELINAAIAVYDEQIEIQNEIKEGIQERIDALQEEHDLREANLNVQKAQWELEKAKNNKTTKVFKEGQGFVFEADQDAVQEAQLNYDNSVYERKIQLLNEEIKKVDKNIESLNKQKKQWEDIIPLMERAALITKAEAYDMDFKNKVLSGNVSLLTTIRDRYGEIYSKIGNLEETKKPYELLQEELTDISQTFSLGGISYADALERTKNAISQYYPELLTKYEEQGTSLDEVAKKQLEGVGVTEETSEENKEKIKNTNEEITQSYKELLKDLTDVFTELDGIMSDFAKKARAITSSVISSVSTISSAILGTGSFADGDFDFTNVVPTQYKKLDDATLDMYNNISKNLNTSLVQGTKISTNTKPPITTTNNNKSTNITFGDIVVNDVKNAHDFAKTIASSLSSAMKQELYK